MGNPLSTNPPNKKVRYYTQFGELANLQHILVELVIVADGENDLV